MRFKACLFPLILALLASPHPALAQGGGAEGGGRAEGAAGIEEQVSPPIMQDHPVVRPEDLEQAHQQIDVLFNVETYRDPGKPYQANVPILYRIDSGPNTEFRVVWGGLAWDRNRTGVKDMALGLKWNVREGNPSLGALFEAELNTGSAGFGDPAVEPLVVLTWGYDFSNGWDLTLNGGVQSMVDGSSMDRYLQGSYAAQVGYSFTKLHRLSATLSGYGPDQEPGGIHRTGAHLGYNFSPDDKTQYSLFVHRGLAPRGTDWGFTLGWSKRY